MPWQPSTESCTTCPICIRTYAIPRVVGAVVIPDGDNAWIFEELHPDQCEVHCLEIGLDTYVATVCEDCWGLMPIEDRVRFYAREHEKFLAAVVEHGRPDWFPPDYNAVVAAIHGGG